MMPLILMILLMLSGLATLQEAMAAPPAGGASFPPPLASYEDENIPGLGAKLAERIREEPFNLFATILFACAVVHTFATGFFRKWAHEAHDQETKFLESTDAGQGGMRDWLRFKTALFHLLGEVEAVFFIWTIPLAVGMALWKGIGTMQDYFTNGVQYTEPAFVIVVIILCSTRPILKLAEMIMAKVAAWGGSTPKAWWFSVLTVGAVLGSFITEPAAMTICALLLAKKFYELRPSATLAYATVGLLFVNVSIGGTLTSFAAPPVLMVARPWDWDMVFMLSHFGWKALVAIVVSTVLYSLCFRREFSELAARSKKAEEKGGPVEEPVPWWVTLVHVLFLAWTVAQAHHIPLFLGGALLFLGFYDATRQYQSQLRLLSPLLVGAFLAGLVVHGGLQGWWIEPVLSGLGAYPLMAAAMVLSAFNDNAAITYLSTLVPSFPDAQKYAVVAGAVTGGGLTVIANAPNPAGQAILKDYFGGGLAPQKLLAGAAVATAIAFLCFAFLPGK